MRKLFAVWPLSTLESSYLITVGSSRAHHQRCCQSVPCLVQLHRERKSTVSSHLHLHNLSLSSAVNSALGYAAAVSNSITIIVLQPNVHTAQQKTVNYGGNKHRVYQYVTYIIHTRTWLFKDAVHNWDDRTTAKRMFLTQDTGKHTQGKSWQIHQCPS